MRDLLDGSPKAILANSTNVLNQEMLRIWNIVLDVILFYVRRYRRESTKQLKCTTPLNDDCGDGLLKFSTQQLPHITNSN